MSGKHTPGPWVIDEFLGGAFKIRGRDAVLCHAHSFTASGKADAESTANARLIAAAPELLAAAKSLLSKLHEYQEDGLDVPGEVLDLEAAINKAEEVA